MPGITPCMQAAWSSRKRREASHCWPGWRSSFPEVWAARMHMRARPKARGGHGSQMTGKAQAGWTRIRTHSTHHKNSFLFIGPIRAPWQSWNGRAHLIVNYILQRSPLLTHRCVLEWRAQYRGEGSWVRDRVIAPPEEGLHFTAQSTGPSEFMTIVWCDCFGWLTAWMNRVLWNRCSCK